MYMLQFVFTCKSTLFPAKTMTTSSLRSALMSSIHRSTALNDVESVKILLSLLLVAAAILVTTITMTNLLCHKQQQQ